MVPGAGLDCPHGTQPVPASFPPGASPAGEWQGPAQCRTQHCALGRSGQAATCTRHEGGERRGIVCACTCMHMYTIAKLHVHSANILTHIHVYMYSHNQVLSAVAESTFHVHVHCAVDVHVRT